MPVTQTIVVNGVFDGAGQTYRAGARMTAPLFEVQSGSLSNCILIGHGVGYGVLITGSDTTIENVSTSQFTRGIEIENCQRVTVTDCKARHCADFGMNAESCDSVTFQRCDSQYNGLDGFKLRAKATNIIFRNCYSAYNGQRWPGSAGDGIDIFAGGNGVLIEDCAVEYNNGYGLTIKTDTLTRDDPLTYGIPGNVTVRRCTVRHNRIWGMIITSGVEASIPLFRGATVEDTTSTDNGYGGLWINAGDVTVNGLVATPNRTTPDVNLPSGMDVLIGSRAENVSLSNVTGTVQDNRA